MARAMAEFAAGLRMVTAEGVVAVDRREKLGAEGPGSVFSGPLRSEKIRVLVAEHRRFYGDSVERWAPFRDLLIEVGVETARRDFAASGERRRAAG
jgi:hypothetical protein